MSNYYRNKINRWRSKMVKRRVAAGQGPDDYEFGMAVADAEKADARITELEAERDALQDKVDTILNYINSEETNEATGFWLKMLLGYEQAAQLKEQDGE